MATVNLSPMPDFPDAVLLTWQRMSVENDVQIAFFGVNALLDQVDGELHIVMDMREDPVLSLKTATNHIIAVNQHPKMGNWLIIGDNKAARITGRAVTMFGRSNIYQVSTMEQAHEYLTKWYAK